MADDRWIPDPQGRADVEKVSRFLKLPIWKGSTLGDFRRFWNELWAKIDENAETINQTISNYCPYRVGDILQTTNSQNPADHWIGTEWKLITEITKGVPLSETAGVVLGSNELRILKENLPKDRLRTEAHYHGRGTMEILGNLGNINYNAAGVNCTDVFFATASGINVSSGSEYRQAYVSFQASRRWTGVTSSSAPYTEPLGEETPIKLNIRHYTVYKWERIK